MAKYLLSRFFLIAFSFSSAVFSQNQTKPNQTKSNQIKSNQIDQSKIDQAFSDLNKEQIEALKKDHKTFEFLKKKLEEAKNKQIPLMMPSIFKEVFSIKIPMCDTKLLSESIKKCSYYSCLEEITVMGMMKLSTQQIIHGFNKQGHCAYSIPTKRYYVPKVNLQDFSKLILGYKSNNLILPERPNPRGQENQKYQSEYMIDGLKCTIDLEVKLTYKKELQLESTKLISYNISARSPKECKSKNITLLLDLEKQGLTETITENPLGYWQP